MRMTSWEMGTGAAAVAGTCLACSLGGSGTWSYTRAYTTASGRNSSRVGQRLKKAFRLAPALPSAAAVRMTSSVLSHSRAAGKRIDRSRAGRAWPG